LSQSIYNYTPKETLFSNSRTLIQRAIRQHDGQQDNASFILKKLVVVNPTEGQVRRFSFAYEVAKKFDHPNILKVVDYLERDGAPVIVQEDSHAIDLRQYCKQQANERLPLEDILSIAIQLADALSVIHHAQVIHKDLHPGNIIINPENQQVQIIDFGLASLLTREQPILAAPERLEGILAYLSPEQTGRMNRSVDYRTDFYTLGITLYELITGHVPFNAVDALGMVHAHIAKTHKPVIKACPNTPPIISSLIDKLLNKVAEERYQSAQGLKTDLEKCLQALKNNKAPQSFPLGDSDISDHFHVPQKLYGRKSEISTLLKHFHKVAEGAPQLLAVSGYSGIGKSALVHEVHKPIAAHNGLFISGKFDQFQRNVPYSAFHQAFKSWLVQTLSLPEKQLQAQRQSLKQILGNNGRVLIDFMAEFKPLLGDLSEVSKLGADETQNRFHLVFIKLISFMAESRPLVLFIDDLQWADRGSLNLLPLLMREADCHLLFIVAYRDNEVDSTHPAMQALKTVSDDCEDCFSSLTLEPLPITEVQQLLIDSLHRPAEEVQPLAALVHHKTGGNPFFINEFLKTLYSEELFNFDLKQHRWLWDTQAITAKGITDNVVELMLEKMLQLPDDTQQMLRLASCVGSRFDIEMLAVVAELEGAEVTRALWPALQDGLLIQEGGDWLLGVDGALKGGHLVMLTNGEYNTHANPIVPHCKFLHDRMLQAAYESMENTQRQQTHLKIGRLLNVLYLEQSGLENLAVEKQGLEPLSLQDNEKPQESTSISLFDIVEQLNQGRSLITDSAEMLYLAELNLQAAEKAKAACVWETVVQYADVGMGLLPENSWQDHYSLTFGLYNAKAEGEYLCGKPDESDLLYDELLTHCKDNFVKAEICTTRLIENIGRGRWGLGIEFGIQGLNYLNISFPSDDVAIEQTLLQEQVQFDEQTKLTPLDQITQLPEMNDQSLLVAVKILANLSACAFIFGRMVLMNLSIIRGLNYILKAGKSDLAVIQLSWYSVILTQTGDYERGINVAGLVRELKAYYPHAQELASSYNILAGLVLPFKESYKYCILQHQKGYETGLENGEIARAAINLNNILFLKYSKGDDLRTVQEQARLSQTISRRKAVFVPHGNNIVRLIEGLVEPSGNGRKVLDDEEFSSDYLNKIKGSLHEYNLFHYRSELAFWYGDKQKSLEISSFSHDTMVTTSKFCCYMDHILQYGLLLVSQSSNSLSKHTSDYAFCLQELKKMAQFCPENFEHKYELLLAEQGRYQNGSMEQVAGHYKNAIESAKANGFIQYQALTNELFALYLQNCGLNNVATAYLEEAIYLYKRWGCEARIVYLKKHYGHFFELDEVFEKVGSETKSSEVTNDDGSLTSEYSHSHTHSHSESASHASSEDKSGLDFDSVMKSAQLISSELKLKQLALKVMKVITESAGAQNAALVLNTDNGPCVEVRVSSQLGSSNSLASSELIASPLLTDSKALDECSDLPLSIISYVLRTDEIVNLANVVNSKDFENDPYLKQQPPQSILCVPVDYRDKIIGVLYLENRLTTKAFTESRLNVIKMLLSQAAISIENARLFEEINTLNQGLEQKVEERTQQLNESNKALHTANEELKSFSYSVSHDLRSPLRSMKGFSQILLDEYSDTLDEMGVSLLQRIMAGSSKMAELINGLLELSRVQRRYVELKPVNLSEMAQKIAEELNEDRAGSLVKFTCAKGIKVQGDARMLYSAIENLLNNAWKYSSKVMQPQVEFGTEKQQGQNVYFVKDNGAGFDMAHAHNLFGTFQRLHSESEFSGTGIGLATVKRIITKHKGKVWAEAEEGEGATFYFTL